MSVSNSSRTFGFVPEKVTIAFDNTCSDLGCTRFPRRARKIVCRLKLVSRSRTASTDSLGHLLKIDQRGMPRPDKEDSGGCDMGAYERQSD
jgi:hypothetical protein